MLEFPRWKYTLVALVMLLALACDVITLPLQGGLRNGEI